MYVFSPSPGEVFGSKRFLTESHYFFWIAALGTILTTDNLRKRKVVIMIGVICAKVRESR